MYDPDGLLSVTWLTTLIKNINSIELLHILNLLMQGDAIHNNDGMASVRGKLPLTSTRHL